MKKIFISFVVLSGLIIGLVNLMRAAPESTNGTSLPVNYGGLSVSTSIFSVNGATVAGWATINSVVFSSGSALYDYVDIFRATSTTMTNPHVNPMVRIYNVLNSTSATGVSFSGLHSVGNLKIGPNWMWKPNVGTYNEISVLYYAGAE